MAKKNLIVDTSVLVRFLARDVESMYLKSVEWFLKAEKGEVKLSIMSIVVAETCYVMQSFYKKDRVDIAEKMEVLISQKWLSVKNRDVLFKCLSLYKIGVHFVDAYLCALSEKSGAEILTFDNKPKKMNRGK